MRPIALTLQLLAAHLLFTIAVAMAKSGELEPPRILFVKHPTALITIDGNPELEKVENSNLMRVVNTPFFLVLDSSTRKYYLRSESNWFHATDVKGPWEAIGRPPTPVVELARNTSGSPALSWKQTPLDEPPRITVSTTPTELIVSDGEPRHSPIGGTGLLYMSNTTSDVFMEISTRRHFVLLSGRWYSSSSMTGFWIHVPSAELPSDFTRIPPGSPRGSVLAHVTGTKEAREYDRNENLRQNVNQKREGLARTGERHPDSGTTRRPRVTSSGPRSPKASERTATPEGPPIGSSDLFSDRNGIVYRRNPDGSWDRRASGGWTREPGTGPSTTRSPTTSSRPTSRSSSDSLSDSQRASLNRRYQAQQRAMHRNSSYNSRAVGRIRR